MCKFCKFTRLYLPTTHHELPPGTTVDGKITTRVIVPPSADDCNFVRESLAATMIAKSHKNMKRYDCTQVEASLELAKACQPKNSKVYDMFALYYLQVEDTENALTSIKTSLKLNNTNGEAFIIASHVYLAQENYEMAMKALEIGLVCVPVNYETEQMRKNIQLEMKKLRSIIPHSVEVQAPNLTITEKNTQKSCFHPNFLTLPVISIILSHAGYIASQTLTLVSHDWNHAVLNSVELKNNLMEFLTQPLVELVDDEISLSKFEEAFRIWRQLEKDQNLRKKFNCYKSVHRSSPSLPSSGSPSTDEIISEINYDSHPQPSSVVLFPHAEFSSLRFKIMQEIISQLPIEFLLIYGVHNGMNFYLTGAMRKEENYSVELYPLDSPKFTNAPNYFIEVPHCFKDQVRADILNSKKVFKIGKIKWNAKYNPIAYDVWGFKFYDDDEEDIRKINILLDTNPMEGGTYGQIVLLQDGYVEDVLPGGIKQLLEYLSTLSTCNLVATLGMETRESVNRLPEHLENDIALFNPKKKKKGLFRTMKRYKSAYKGFQCNMRN